MFTVVAQTPEEIVLTYVVVLSACLLTYPMVRLIMAAILRGLERWR
jgi:hypothetical protein